MLDTVDKDNGDKVQIDPIVTQIAQIIYDKAGKNIYAVDIRDVSTLCDYCIIAEGTVDRHVKAIGRTLMTELAALGHKPVKVEGEQEGHWLILDYLNVMVHVLTPNFREKYRLERLWDQGRILELNLEQSDAIYN